MDAPELLSAYGNEPAAGASDKMELDEDEAEKLNETSSTEAALDASGGSKTARGNEAAEGMLAPLITQDNVDIVIEHSGGVPLYTIMFAEDPGWFQQSIDDAVGKSIGNLYDNCQNRGPRDEWNEDVKVAILSSLLGIKARDTDYDKKFLLKKVINRARLYLMNFVAEKESTLLGICADGSTTNDTRGRVFERMAIRRCQAFRAKFLVESETAEFAARKYVLFHGEKLPLPVETTDNIMHIPTNPNFKAIDWYWTLGKKAVVAVQAHVNAHDDVFSPLWGMAVSAGWFHRFNHVELIYLSPEDATVDLVAARVTPPLFTGRASGPRKEELKNKTILRRAISRLSIETLKDLQWPDGRSLPPA